MTNSVTEIRQERSDILDKAQAVHDKAKSEGRDLTGSEKSELERVLDVELPNLDRELAIAEAREQNLRQRAIENLGANDGLPKPSSESLTFRDAATGRIVRALGPNDRLSAQQEIQRSEGATAGKPHPSVAGGVPRESLSAPDVGELLVSQIAGRLSESLAAQIGGDDVTGGVLLPAAIGAQIIDLARAPTVSIPLGAQTIPMTGAQLDLVRVDQEPQGHWRAETEAVKSSEMSFGRISLRPKMLAAVVPVSIELMEDASNAAQMIKSGISSAMALQIDRAILMGTGAENEPRGITNYPGVNTVTGVGVPANYSPVTSAVGAIIKANYSGEPSGLGWVMHPRDAETYDGLVDSTGQPLRPTPWAGALRQAATTSMPSELGAGSNESEMIVGDFRQVVLGIRTGVSIRVLDSGEVTDSSGTRFSAAEQFLRLIVVHTRVDVAVLRPSWFTVLSGVTAS